MALIEQFVDLREHDLPTDPLKKVAALPVVNRGGYVTGPPGVGKTLLIRHIEEWIARCFGEGQVVYKISELHTGARMMGGQTCRSLCHQKVYNKMHGVWIIMDEAFQTHLESWARISEWKLLGAKYIIIGDPYQMLPIGEDRCCMHNSRMLWDLVDGLHVELTECRRASDPRLFDWYYQLRFSVDRPSLRVEKVRETQRRYPWDGVCGDLFFVITHEKRLRLNAHYNEREFRRHHPEAIFLKCEEQVRGATCQPQDMWLYPGQELMGCSRGNRKIVNGVIYTVREVDRRAGGGGHGPALPDRRGGRGGRPPRAQGGDRAPAPDLRRSTTRASRAAPSPTGTSCSWTRATTTSTCAP